MLLFQFPVISWWGSTHFVMGPYEFELQPCSYSFLYVGVYISDIKFMNREAQDVQC